MPYAMAIGAVLGLAKTEFVDKPNAQKQAQIQGQIERYSPWTGHHGNPVTPPSDFGGALEGAGAGLTIGSKLQGLKGGQTPSQTSSTSGWGDGSGDGWLTSDSLNQPQSGDSYLNGGNSQNGWNNNGGAFGFWGQQPGLK